MKFKCLSLFSSAGVAETYFSKHNVEVKVAAELLQERVTIYRHLYPDVDMYQGDITIGEHFAAIMMDAKKNGCDFILATPPCQGMSTAGKMLKDDPRNRLIIYVVKAIKEIYPKFVMIENVPEILSTKIEVNGEWMLINDYLLLELGGEYLFNDTKVVNAMNYGTAQSRERCVYLLSRKDMGYHWNFPEPSSHITTMREAIGDLPSLDPDVTDLPLEKRLEVFPDYEKKKEAGLKISKWHYPPKHKWRHVVAMMHTPEGNTAWDNQTYFPTLADGTRSKGYHNTYKRQWWDRPANTITKYTSRLGSQDNGHPGRAIVDSPSESERIWSDARTMTVFELIRLTGLPDNWGIPENASSNVIREILGEGVPPRLLEAALIKLQNEYEVQK